MRRLVSALLIAALQLVRALPPTSDQVLALFTRYLESLRAQAGIPGLAGAIMGGSDVAWEGAFGRQDVERSIFTRADTPFHFDGLMQVFTASLVLRCVEEGRLSLDDPIGRYATASPDPNATIRQILTHTSGTPNNLVFAYRPQRLDSLSFAIQACTGDSFRVTVAKTLSRLGMADSVPGPDAINVPPEGGIPDGAAVDRYTAALGRLATPYAVDAQGRAARSQYTVTTLTPSGGLISTARDFERFDLALKAGVIVRPETLTAAWRPPAGRDGQPLPHGLGWFVQQYNGEMVVWQFGIGDNASSSLVVAVPARGLTLILLANSDGLVKSFTPVAGDLTTSPFGRLFLGQFVR